MAPQVNYWRSRIVIPYMFREMINNARSSEVATIRFLNQMAVGNIGPDPRIIIAGGAKATQG